MWSCTECGSLVFMHTRKKTLNHTDISHHLTLWELIISGWWFRTCFMFHFIYGIIHDNPSHWRTPSFFKMVIAPPSRFSCGMTPEGVVGRATTKLVCHTHWLCIFAYGFSDGFRHVALKECRLNCPNNQINAVICSGWELETGDPMGFQRIYGMPPMPVSPHPMGSMGSMGSMGPCHADCGEMVIVDLSLSHVFLTGKLVW